MWVLYCADVGEYIGGDTVWATGTTRNVEKARCWLSREAAEAWRDKYLVGGGCKFAAREVK